MLLNVIVSLAVRQFICALLSEMLTVTNLGILNVIRNDIMEEAHTVSQRYSNPSEYKSVKGNETSAAATPTICRCTPPKIPRLELRRGAFRDTRQTREALL